MRSFALTAAIAAALVTTSLTAGYAASAKHHPHYVHKEQARVERSISNDPYADHGLMAFLPSMQAFGFFTQQRPRLSLIESELGQTEQRINADRRHGYLTSAEARAARDEDRSIQTTAMYVAAKNGGDIPDCNYDMLCGRVAGLNQAIRLETGGSRRA